MIYVDQLFQLESKDPRAFRIGQKTGHRWCHMWADRGEQEDLHALAHQIGLKRAWFQPHPRMPHYDLTPKKRTEALRWGAVEMDPVEWLRREAALQREGL